MKTIQKAAALAMALLCCLMVFPVSAATPATLTVAGVSAKVGDTVTIPVEITRVENIASVEVHIGYDTSALRCVDAQMSETVKAISMSNVNPEPKGHPDEVWLTAVGTNAVVLEGAVMTISFEVLDTASAGTTPLTVRKVTLLDTDIQDIAVTAVDGSVNVEDGVSQKPTDTTTADNTTSTTQKQPVESTTVQSTTVQSGTDATVSTVVTGEDPTSVATKPTQTVAPETESQETVVSPGGETLVLPEQTVVDSVGSVVTDASGEPTRVRTVAVMLSNATGTPNNIVEVTLSLSAVADLSAMGIAVHYDTTALQFESGECVGFVRDGANMTSVTEHQKGVVDISATAVAMGGSGDIAVLRFKVREHAKNGDYRIAVKGTPLLQSGNVELPVKSVTGKITVEGGREGGIAGLSVNPAVLAVGAVILVLVIVTVVFAIVRRKQTSTAPKGPAVVDVSGEEEE